MTRLEFTTEIDAPLAKVWAFHANIENLPRITPPAIRVRLPRPLPAFREGERFRMVLFQPPFYLPMTWEVVYATVRPLSLSIDEQGSVGPFAFWRQEHLFEDLGDGRTRLRDSVTYRAPFGVLGALADRTALRGALTAMFAYRHRKTREILESR